MFSYRPLFRRVVIAIPLAALVTTLLGENGQPRNLLAGARSLAWVEAQLVSADEFNPAVSANDREAWGKLPSDVRAAYIAEGEEQLAADWAVLPASTFLEFVRTGNRSHYEAVRNKRRAALQALTLAEVLDNRGRFLDQIANGIWATCEETFWGIPAHLAYQKLGPGLPDVTEPVVELFVAETGAQLAWTHYLLGERLDAVSPLIRARIVQEIDRRVLTPFLTRDDFGWMGYGTRKYLNNWTPWITSNILACTLLIEKDPARRTAIVHKALRILDNFLNTYSTDGGCDEGPSYWSHAGGSLFDCLELLRNATNGRLNVFHDPLIREIGRYIYRVHIDGDWFVNVGDASARPRPDGTLIFRFGERIGDVPMVQLGAWLAQSRVAEGELWRGPLGRLVPALLHREKILATTANPPRPQDTWLPALQMMVARDHEGDSSGLFLAAQGGHNGQSHNHNDVGSFVIAVNGRPTLIDVGVEAYTAKTFGSGQRYKIWTMQSDYHNVPTINGVMQGAGRNFAARNVTYHRDDTMVEFSLDLAGAYAPEAGVTQWIRTFKFVRGHHIEIADAYSLERPGGHIVFNLMTGRKVNTETPGKLILSGTVSLAEKDDPKTVVEYDPTLLDVTVEEIAVGDAGLRAVWGEAVHRIRLTTDKAPQTGVFTFHVNARAR